MTNKESKESNKIYESNEYNNQNTSQGVEHKNPLTNNDNKLYSQENKTKIPDLQILNINCITHKYIDFKEDLIEYSYNDKMKIPDLNVQNHMNVSIKNFHFNSEILRIDQINKIVVPDFNIISPTYVKFNTLSFSNFIIVNKIDTPQTFVPNLNVMKIRPILIFNDIHFNSNIYAEIRRPVNTTTITVSESSPSNSNSFYEDLKLPWDENSDPFNGIKNASKFLIITVNNKYSEFVGINYRDIYRIYNGGFPHIERVENIDELQQTLQQTGERELIIVKDTEKSDHLDKIIDNIPYQQSGCIILGTDNVNKFREYNSNIIILEDDIFKKMENYESKLIDVVSGFNCTSVDNKSITNLTFTDFAKNFEKAITNFDDKVEYYSNIHYLKKLLKKELYEYIIRNMDLLIKTNSKMEKNATSIHAGMKGFVCVYKSDNVNNEITLEGKNESDVYVLNNNKEEYYEAETFFGRGDPHALIAYKIKKYTNYSGKLIFLIRNIDIIRYFYQFKALLTTYKHNQNFPEIEIYGFNFNDNRIESIREIANYLNKYNTFAK